MKPPRFFFALASLGLALPLRAQFGPPPGMPQGPFNDETWIAFSRDGLTFEGRRRILRQASVPDLAVLRDGRMLVYFVDFSDPRSPEGLGLAVSEDGGKSFSRRRARIKALSALKAVDPDPVALEDGRVRLYYFASSPPPPGQGPRDPALAEGPHEVRSAVSKDGMNFEEEPGLRFSHEGLTDPDVVRLPSGACRMYFPVHAGPDRGRVLSASSKDCLSFSRDPGVRFPAPGIPGALVLPDGRVRLYVNGPGGILALISRDGLAFQAEGVAVRSNPGEGLIADPGPARLADGTYALVYKKRPFLP
ncbi:MAG: exo-alpha-sialidase [Elusimicrobia bacterium]|nr:exo-alpha-sialidase [Elusimicrobiota bacterium]